MSLMGDGPRNGAPKSPALDHPSSDCNWRITQLCDQNQKDKDIPQLGAWIICTVMDKETRAPRVEKKWICLLECIDKGRCKIKTQSTEWAEWPDGLALAKDWWCSVTSQPKPTGNWCIYVSTRLISSTEIIELFYTKFDSSYSAIRRRLVIIWCRLGDFSTWVAPRLYN